MPRIAVLLSGCGNMDGSEIHESVCALIAIDRKGWEIVFTAPNVVQQRTVSFLNGDGIPRRNALQESARIARGRIFPLSVDILERIDAIVVPGGLGAVTTLCDYAINGVSCETNPDVSIFIKSAHKKGIPIGAMCIAPVLIARCLPGVTVTVGTDEKTALEICAMGCHHIDCPADQAVVDKENKVVTTPAYMTATGPAQVMEGAISMINAIEELING